MMLDWSKNSRGNDHGALFQMADRKRTRSTPIDYDNSDETDPELAQMEMGFSRVLSDIILRLELLGFTLSHIEKEYLQTVKACREERLILNEDGFNETLDLMTFAEFCDFIIRHPVQALDGTYISPVDVDGEQRKRERFSDERITQRLPHYSTYDTDGYSERSYFGSLIRILHPYSILRLLAESSENLNAQVLWQYGPLVQNGWENESEFVSDARRTQTFLIATEGSSDAHILKHAFALLRPEIADFFRFIDISERHPFPGTGNLLKFAEGLAKIDVHNQVIFLLDNDAEGFDAHRRMLKSLSPR
jgi:HEPN/Toprim N-terminal domain 1